MDDYCDRSYPGWSEGIAAAEQFCQKVWLPTGEQAYAVLWTDLVQLRQLPAKAQGADS